MKVTTSFPPTPATSSDLTSQSPSITSSTTTSASTSTTTSTTLTTTTLLLTGCNQGGVHSCLHGGICKNGHCECSGTGYRGDTCVECNYLFI
jgi:hypothetical protein